MLLQFPSNQGQKSLSQGNSLGRCVALNSEGELLIPFVGNFTSEYGAFPWCPSNLSFLRNRLSRNHRIRTLTTAIDNGIPIPAPIAASWVASHFAPVAEIWSAAQEAKAVFEVEVGELCVGIVPVELCVATPP